MARVDRQHVTLSLVLLVGILTLPAWSWGQTTERIGTVLAVEGTAEVRAVQTTAQTTDWERLRFRDGIFLNDTVRTAADSKLKVLMQDDSILTLAEQSEMQFTDFLLTEQQRRSIVNLFVGKIRVLTTRLFGTGSVLEVHTPNAVAGIRGSEEHVWYNAATQQTTVLCASGRGTQGDHCYIRDPADANRLLNIPEGHIVEQRGLGLPNVTRQALTTELRTFTEGTRVTAQDPKETLTTDKQQQLPGGREATGPGTTPGTESGRLVEPDSSKVRSAGSEGQPPPVRPSTPNTHVEAVVSPTITSPIPTGQNPQMTTITPDTSPTVKNTVLSINIVIRR